MTNRHLLRRIQRVLGVSSPERRTPWAKGALALCAAAIAIATLMPLRASSHQTPHAPSANQDRSVLTVKEIKLRLMINGDAIELTTDRSAPTPNTPVHINGAWKQYRDLDAAQQQAVLDAVKTIPADYGDGTMKVLVRNGVSSTGISTAQTSVSKSKTSGATIMMSVGPRDTIELHSLVLKPETVVKLNGKERRFRELSAQQKNAVQAAIKQLSSGSGAQEQKVKAPQNGKTASVSVAKSGNITGVQLNVGDKADSIPRNGNKAQVQVNLAGKFRTVSVGDKLKFLLDIDGDDVEITVDKTDFSTKDLTPDSRVSVNGKEGRFGDLTEHRQQQIRECKMSVHRITSLPTKGGANGALGEVKNEAHVLVDKVIPVAPLPDNPE